MRRHEADGVSLVFGVIFCGIAALWALVVGGALEPHHLRVAVPVMLIVAGVAGVSSSLLRKDRSADGRKVGDQSAGSPTRSST